MPVGLINASLVPECSQCVYTFPWKCQESCSISGQWCPLVNVAGFLWITKTKIIPCFFRPRRSCFQSHIFALALFTHSFSFIHSLTYFHAGNWIKGLRESRKLLHPRPPSPSLPFTFLIFLSTRSLYIA